MKKLIVVLGLALSFIIALYAEDSVKPYHFARLEAEAYQLSLSVSTNANRVYATASFTLDGESLPEADYYSFFITKTAYLEKVKINGKSVTFHYTKDLDPRLFEPEFDHCELLDVTAPVHCVSIAKEDLGAKKGKIHFSLSYRMFLPEYEIDEQGRAYLGWDTKDFFYPKNPDKSAELNIIMLSTRYFELANATREEVDGNLKTSYLSVFEEPGKSNKFRLYSVR